MDFMFFIRSVLLGAGLAMDAFSVSLANGLNEQNMKKGKMLGISGIFAFFQALMPLIGWVCVHTVVTYFTAFSSFVPYIALVLLAFIGGKMIFDSLKKCDCDDGCSVGFIALIVQGIATSIDALSVGFTIAEYAFIEALVCALIIALVTFVICFIGVYLGKKFGTKLSNKACIFGGVLLIIIGLEIFLTGILA